jgi:hypothetical protein
MVGGKCKAHAAAGPVLGDRESGALGAVHVMVIEDRLFG